MNKSFFQRVQESFIKGVSHVRWKQRSYFSQSELELIKPMLAHDYFIIATRRRNYVTSFLINLSHFFLTGKWGYYTHVLMNLEDEVHSDADFRFIEATTKGTKFSTFDEVFSKVDGIALIKPKSMTLMEWTDCLDAAKVHLGKPYDNLFNLKDQMEINCVELVRLALMRLPDYDTRFSNFEKMLKNKKYLTPDMFAQCEDFHTLLEMRK